MTQVMETKRKYRNLLKMRSECQKFAKIAKRSNDKFSKNLCDIQRKVVLRFKNYSIVKYYSTTETLRLILRIVYANKRS